MTVFTLSKLGLSRRRPLGRIGRLTGSILVLTLLMLTGCSRTGKVIGTVTVDGKPLPRGKIVFTAENGRNDSATIEDGKFTLLKAPVGPGVFTVDTSEVFQMKMSMMGGPPGAKPGMPKMGFGGPKPPGGEMPDRLQGGVSKEEFDEAMKKMQGGVGQRPVNPNVAAMENDLKKRMEKGELIEVQPLYADPKKSPLKYTVKRGEQTHSLEVKAMEGSPLEMPEHP